MTKLLSISLMCLSTLFFSQKNETYIKANALFLPIGILNVGLERGFTEHITGQAEIFFSPWKSFNGHNALIGIGTIEGRYYFKEAFKHFYVGATIGFAKYNMSKWNYWKSDFYYTKEGKQLPYRMDQLYQKGFSYMLGVTTGYQFQLGSRWNMDVYLGIVSQQSFYKGYVKGLPEIQENRYDEVVHWNKSGEIIPIKGGVMISYKL